MKASADTLGINGTFIDPLWRIEVRLTPIQQDLLRSWWVRRLGFIDSRVAGVSSRVTIAAGVLDFACKPPPRDIACHGAGGRGTVRARCC